jgi:RNA polymerase primary sigma factor/RNA polymerase nonessential primary-like sigma factor
MELPPAEVTNGLVGADTHEQYTATLDRMVECYSKDPEVLNHLELVKVKPRDPGNIEDMLQQFAKDIGQYSVPSEQEQQALAYTIRKGVEAQQQLEQDASRVELIPDIKAAVSARQEMILRNAKLVVSWANKIGINNNNDNYSKLDRIEEGMIGLARAVAMFDPARGYKFSTYASWWIRQAIQRGRPNHELVSLPVREMDRLVGLAGIKDGLERTLRRTPTNEELLAEFNSLYAGGQQSKGIEESELALLNNLAKRAVSLNVRVDFRDGDGEELGDTIIDKTKVPLFADQIEKLEQEDELSSLLTRADLSSFERLVISLRFGLPLIKPDDSFDVVPDEYLDLSGRHFKWPEYQEVMAAISDSQGGTVPIVKCAQLTGVRSCNISLIVGRVINKIRAYNSIAA